MYGDLSECIIASVSLGAARPFQLRPKAAAATAAAATSAAATAATTATTATTATLAVAEVGVGAEADTEAEAEAEAVGGRGAGQLRYMLLSRQRAQSVHSKCCLRSAELLLRVRLAAPGGSRHPGREAGPLWLGLGLGLGLGHCGLGLGLGLGHYGGQPLL